MDKYTLIYNVKLIDANTNNTGSLLIKNDKIEKLLPHKHEDFETIIQKSTCGKLLRQKLTESDKSCTIVANVYSREEIKMENQIQQLQSFLNEAHSVYHAVSALERTLVAAGYEKLQEQTG